MRTEKKYKQENFIVVNNGQGLCVIASKNILFCEAYKTNCIFYLESGEKITATRSLKFYEEKLTEWKFMKIHKSKLVNVNKIKKYDKGKNGKIVLSNQTEIPLAKKNKRELIQRFTFSSNNPKREEEIAV